MLMYKKLDQNYLLRYPVYQGFFFRSAIECGETLWGRQQVDTSSAFKPKPRAATRASLKPENQDTV